MVIEISYQAPTSNLPQINWEQESSLFPTLFETFRINPSSHCEMLFFKTSFLKSEYSQKFESYACYYFNKYSS